MKNFNFNPLKTLRKQVNTLKTAAYIEKTNNGETENYKKIMEQLEKKKEELREWEKWDKEFDERFKKTMEQMKQY